MNTLENKIAEFFTSPAYGVAGASSNRDKFGNKVLCVYLEHNKKVYPINPREKIIEGITCVPDVESLPNEVKSLSIITPPVITEKIVEAAVKKGIQHIWMQPGAESEAAIQLCEKHNITIIAKGPCILVILGSRHGKF
jgi:predicted CoA-binding protein